MDVDWAALLACDPHTVLTALKDAFADNEAAASAVGVEDTEVSLLVIVPPVSEVPERRPTLTQAGNLSLKKLTKTELADVYKLLICGHIVVTLRETFAVAPGLVSARIVALRASEADAHGHAEPEVIAAARCTRAALAGVQWQRVNAAQIVNDCCTEIVMIQKGVTGALQPVPLETEPELRTLLAAVDMSEVMARD